MGKEAGWKSENYFHSLMNKEGVPVKYCDDWFDFLIYDKIKVEVKSCQITIKDYKRYRVGRFDFTNKDNLELQRKENIWVCFIVRHHDQFILYGFVKSLSITDKRYVSIHKARDLKPLELAEWLERIKQEADI